MEPSSEQHGNKGSYICFFLTQRRRERRGHAENYFTQNYYFTQKTQRIITPEILCLSCLVAKK